MSLRFCIKPTKLSWKWSFKLINEFGLKYWLILLLAQVIGSAFAKNDSATLTISAQNNLLKDQLESSISQLKDLFKKDGLELVNVNISNEDNRSLFSYQDSDLNLEKNDLNQSNNTENTNNINVIIDYRIIDEYV